MTETKRPKRNGRKYKLQEKWKILKYKFTGNIIEILRQLGLWKHWFIDFGGKNWRHSHF
jgi:hypothetical protein